VTIYLFIDFFFLVDQAPVKKKGNKRINESGNENGSTEESSLLCKLLSTLGKMHQQFISTAIQTDSTNQTLGNFCFFIFLSFPFLNYLIYTSF